MKDKYCAYCSTFKPDEGFKHMFHLKSGTRRSMCPACQTLRKKPHEELVALAQRDKEERKKR